MATIFPLHQRMLEDMQARQLSSGTQKANSQLPALHRVPTTLSRPRQG